MICRKVNDTNLNLEKIDVLILCGGLGTRLGSISIDTPKSLLKIGDKAFIDILIDNLSSYGIKNYILLTGHLKDKIKRHFDYYCSDDHNYSDYNIKFSEEDRPLGTGGALKNAMSLIDSDPFIVMNGDSHCYVDFDKLYNFHVDKNALLTIVASSYNRCKLPFDYFYGKNEKMSTYPSGGTLTFNAESKLIESYSEKTRIITLVPYDDKTTDSKSKVATNAGIYIMSKKIFDFMSKYKNGNFSLEYNFFPDIIKTNAVYGYVTDSEIIDIGTVERYKKAQSQLQSLQLTD